MIIFSAHIPEVGRGGCQTLACGWWNKVKTLVKTTGFWISHLGLYCFDPYRDFWFLVVPLEKVEVWPPLVTSPAVSQRPPAGRLCVCTTSVPTTTVCVPSLRKEIKSNLQVRLCGPHLSSSHRLCLKSFPSLPLRRNMESSRRIPCGPWQSQIRVDVRWPAELYVWYSLWRTSWLGDLCETGGKGVMVPRCGASRDCWFTLVREGTWSYFLCVQLCNFKQVGFHLSKLSCDNLPLSLLSPCSLVSWEDAPDNHLRHA